MNDGKNTEVFMKFFALSTLMWKLSLSRGCFCLRWFSTILVEKSKKAYTSGFGEATIIRFFAQDDRRGHFHIV
jgi:hypothetical protein